MRFIRLFSAMTIAAGFVLSAACAENPPREALTPLPDAKNAPVEREARRCSPVPLASVEEAAIPASLTGDATLCWEHGARTRE